jgi:hypothetical protein
MVEGSVDIRFAAKELLRTGKALLLLLRNKDEGSVTCSDRLQVKEMKEANMFKRDSSLPATTTM